MFLRALHPLVPEGFFGMFFAHLVKALTNRIQASDQGFHILPAELRARTLGVYVRLWDFGMAFHRLSRLAREGRLRVRRARPAAAVGASAEASEGSSASEGTAPSDGKAEAEDAKPVRAKKPQYRAPFTDPRGHFPEHPPYYGEVPPQEIPPMRGFGWMRPFLPSNTMPFPVAFLAHADLIELVQSSPQAARLLRPILRGLGITPPEGFFPKLPPRKSRKKPKSEHKLRRPPRRSPNFVPSPRQFQKWGLSISPQTRARRWAKEKALQEAELRTLGPEGAAAARQRRYLNW